jgi:outer membrane biosynthesis protein TonB
MISLVTITHPIDPGAEVPFIGGRAPRVRVQVDARIADTIRELGFKVEVHEKNYDPVAVQAKKAAKLAAALAASRSKTPAKKPEPKVETKPEPKKPEPKVETKPEPKKPEPKVETKPEPEAKAEGESEEASAEEVAALRERINSLDTLAKAKEFIAEFSIELDPSLTKLKDIKTALLGMVDSPK